MSAEPVVDELEPLVLRSRRHIDVLLAVIFLPLALGAIGVVILGHIRASDFEGVRGGMYFLILFRLFGPVGPAMTLLAFALWFGTLGAGAAWRALDRRPLLIADIDGVVLHPTFSRDKVSWNKVKRVAMAGSAPGYLEFSLVQRVWSMSAPLTSTCVRLDRSLLGMSTRELRRQVPKLNRLKKAAKAASARPIEPGRRDPDAVD